MRLWLLEIRGDDRFQPQRNLGSGQCDPRPLWQPPTLPQEDSPEKIRAGDIAVEIKRQREKLTILLYMRGSSFLARRFFPK